MTRDALATRLADNVHFISHDATAYDALDLFDDYRRAGRTLDAILVSQDARKDTSVLGIATIYEVPKFLALTRGR